MKQKIILIGSLLGAFATTSCGSGYLKVSSVTYTNMNGSTIASFSSSIYKTRIKLASFRFDSSSTSHGSEIDGFYNTWYFGFTYRYNIITGATDWISVPGTISISLVTPGQSTETAVMTFDGQTYGEYENFTEAYVNPSTLSAKQLEHRYRTFVSSGNAGILKYQNIYYPNSSGDYSPSYSLQFYRSTPYQLFTIQSAPDYFVQADVQSFFYVPKDGGDVIVRYTQFPNI